MSELTPCAGCGKLVHWCEPCNICGYVLKKEIKILDPKNKDERILILEKDNRFFRDMVMDYQKQYFNSLKTIKEYEVEQDQILITVKKTLEFQYEDKWGACAYELEQLIEKIEVNKCLK